MTLIKTRISSCKEFFLYIIFHLHCELFFEVHTCPYNDLHFSGGPKRVKWLAHPPCLGASSLLGSVPFSYMMHLRWGKSTEPWWSIFPLLRVTFSFCRCLGAQPAPGGSAEWWPSKPSAGLQTWSSPSYVCPAACRGSKGLTQLPVSSGSQWCWANFKHSLKQFFSFFLEALQVLSPEFVSILLLLVGTWFERKTFLTQ